MNGKSTGAANGKIDRPGQLKLQVKPALSIPKKLAYYGIMLLLTLLALEGLARLAYYLAFDQGYGGGRAVAAAAEPAAAATEHRWRHPFYAYIPPDPWADLNLMPPPERNDTVVIALLGGSVANEVAPYLRRAVYRYFSANALPRRPLVLALTFGGMKQPQQFAVAANTLLLGGHFDLLVNLDGFNETYSAYLNYQQGVFPFFPNRWSHTLDLTAEETLLIGRIALLREEQAELRRNSVASPFRYTALYGIVNRYRWERVGRQILQRNHDLTAIRADYSLEKHGPRRTFSDDDDFLQEAARVWYRGSRLLAQLAQRAGADYYHFLQPNHYVPGAKTLTAAEQAIYRAGSRYERVTRQGYPKLQEFEERLQKADPAIHYYDLTGIFAGHRETLIRDSCCHFNERGQELLAAAILERMEPALRRAAAAGPPVSGLAAAARPAPPEELLIDAAFQVYRRDGNYLLYVKDNCAAADLENPFFLYTLPVDLTDLPADRRDHGFENYDFAPYKEGGGIINGRCFAEKQLRAYPLTAIRTGQFNAAGEIWSGEHHFSE